MYETSEEDMSIYHILDSEWNLFAHLPHDIDWSLKSYKLISKMRYVEESVQIFKLLSENIVTNCMLFIMKDGINPIWEDEKNKNGGCFSYKINNNNTNTTNNNTITDVWNKLCFSLMGGTLLKSSSSNNINGITISPKKNFCIIKIWMSDCTNQNPNTINYFDGISASGCLFKKHM